MIYHCEDCEYLWTSKCPFRTHDRETDRKRKDNICEKFEVEIADYIWTIEDKRIYLCNESIIGSVE